MLLWCGEVAKRAIGAAQSNLVRGPTFVKLPRPYLCGSPTLCLQPKAMVGGRLSIQEDWDVNRLCEEQCAVGAQLFFFHYLSVFLKL